MSWSLLFSFSNNDLKLFGLKPTDFVHALLPHHKYMELNLYFWKPVLTDILNKSKKLQGYKAFLSMWMQLGKCDLSRTPFCKEGPFLCKGDNFQDYKSKKNCNYNFCNMLNFSISKCCQLAPFLSSYTVWKLQDFSDNQNLREIKVCQSRIS